MSVLEFTTGGKFVIRVIKYLATNPDNKWANSYEFQASADGTDSDLTTLITAVVSFEVAFHRSAVIFDRALASTWGEDSKPYDPSTFLVVPLETAGDSEVSADLLPLDKTLSIARVPQSGRVGHLFYRGCLAEDQVSAPAGKSIINDKPALQTAIDAALVSSELENYIGTGAPGPLHMVMIDRNGDVVRTVLDLSVKGVGTVPADHAWFNRPSSPTPP
jgi:hypothetical protein